MNLLILGTITGVDSTAGEVTVTSDYSLIGLELGTSAYVVRKQTHDELVAALEAVYNDPYTTCQCAEKVRAVLAKAKGTE